MGSNLGESFELLLLAWQKLSGLEKTEGVELSHPYQSSPVGMESENLFVNAVAKIETALEPLVLLDNLLEIEKDLGRKRVVGIKGYQDRSLDLDLLYYGEQCIDVPRLQVPHPRCGERLFVLEPLVEVASDVADPVSGKSFAEMLSELHDQLGKGSLAPQEIYRKTW